MNPLFNAKNVPIPSVDDSSGLRLLPLVLSVLAGSVDAIGFLWHGLFLAHITGNLVLVAAHLVAGTPIGLATILSVPAFVVILGLVNLTVVRLEAVGISSLQAQLLVQLVFVAGSFAVGLLAGTHGSRNSAASVTALILGVCGLATQNALVNASIRGAPSTAVMTTDLTRFTRDVSEMLWRANTQSAEAARTRAALTWPAIVGFGGGAAVGAALYAGVGIESLALPFALAILAVVLLRVFNPGHGEGQVGTRSRQMPQATHRRGSPRTSRHYDPEME